MGGARHEDARDGGGPEEPASTRPPRRLAGGSAVTLAVAVMNVSAYAFTILAARLLGPSEFGAVAALMGLLLVLNVAGLGLQTTGARRVATTPDRAPGPLADAPRTDDRHGVARQVMTVAYVSALGLGVLTLAAAPAVSQLFGLASSGTAALLSVTVALQTVFFGQAGVIQGERRWAPLAWLYALNGAGRLACGAVTMAIRPDAFGAMLGVALGSVLPVLVGAVALRREGSLRPTAWSSAQGELREVLRNARALLAFLGVSNADIIVARVALSPHESGLYGGGLILAKAVLFLPQFLIVLGFPTMAGGGEARARTHQRGLLVLTALGLGAAAGTALLPGLALQFVGGAEYAEIEDQLWLFALLGLALSLVQFLVYDAVARQDHSAVLTVWVALVALAASALVVTSVSALVIWALTVDTLLVLALLALSLRPGRVGTT